METMLKTGEVARLLGVSRQHVADLCDGGKVKHVRVGTHRRIRGAKSTAFWAIGSRAKKRSHCDCIRPC